MLLHRITVGARDVMTDERSLKHVIVTDQTFNPAFEARDVMTDERSLKQSWMARVNITTTPGARRDDRREVIETVEVVASFDTSD